MVLFIIIFLIILLFIPIPIKIHLFYKEKIFSLYIFKFKIDLFSKNKNKKIRKSKSKKSKKFFKINIKKLLTNLRYNSFKPSFKSYLDLSYSLNDSCNTAILYGLLNQSLPILTCILNLFFNYEVKRQILNPLFKNQNYISFSFEGIITINIAKTIYILFLIVKSLD